VRRRIPCTLRLRTTKWCGYRSQRPFFGSGKANIAMSTCFLGSPSPAVAFQVQLSKAEKLTAVNMFMVFDRRVLANWRIAFLFGSIFGFCCYLALPPSSGSQLKTWSFKFHVSSWFAVSGRHFRASLDKFPFCEAVSQRRMFTSTLGLGQCGLRLREWTWCRLLGSVECRTASLCHHQRH
jgi:hypothetical protein